MKKYPSRRQCLRHHLFFILMLPLTASALVHDGIVAVVDNDIITQSELNKTLLVARQRAKASGMALPNESDMQKQVLDLLIYNKLQLNQAHQRGIDVSEDELDAAIARLRKQQNLSESDFEKAIKNEGLTLDVFKKNIKEQLLVQKLIGNTIGRHIVVTEDELDRAWSKAEKEIVQYHLSDFWYAVEDESDQKVLDKAKVTMTQFVKDLKSGKLATDLLAYPINHNIHQQSMSARPLSQMPKVFAEVAPSLQPAQSSQVIKAANGFHVLVLEDKKGGIDKASLKQRLTMQKIQEKRKHWLEQLKAMAYVKINL